jgi:hypothetical protein
VTWLAQRLKITLIVRAALVLGDDVVNLGCRDHLAIALMLSAQYVRVQP